MVSSVEGGGGGRSGDDQRQLGWARKQGSWLTRGEVAGSVQEVGKEVVRHSGP